MGKKRPKFQQIPSSSLKKPCGSYGTSPACKQPNSHSCLVMVRKHVETHLVSSVHVVASTRVPFSGSSDRLRQLLHVTGPRKSWGPAGPAFPAVVVCGFAQSLGPFPQIPAFPTNPLLTGADGSSTGHHRRLQRRVLLQVAQQLQRQPSGRSQVKNECQCYGLFRSLHFSLINKEERISHTRKKGTLSGFPAIRLEQSHDSGCV